MKKSGMRTDRRGFLMKILGAGAWGALGFPGFSRAMGSLDIVQGIHQVKGEVRINGTPAQIGSIVAVGDVVTTGPPESHAVFVVGRDAYLLRDNSRLEVSASSEGLKEQTADVLRLLQGKMLAVLKKGTRRVEMPTAVVGIRGSGMYCEVEPSLSYICACYGEFQIQAAADPNARKEFTSKHHEYAHYIPAQGPSSELIVRTTMKNHTDSELIMLEALVGRIPPFVKKDAQGDSPKDYGGGKGNGGY